MSHRLPLLLLLATAALLPAAEPTRADIRATGGYNGQICIWEFACGTWRSRFTANP